MRKGECLLVDHLRSSLLIQPKTGYLGQSQPFVWLNTGVFCLYVYMSVNVCAQGWLEVNVTASLLLSILSFEINVSYITGISLVWLD